MTTTETVADRLAGYVTTRRSAALPEPPHPQLDGDHTRQLADSIDEHGWDGPPLVMLDDIAVTGSHRYAALNELFNESGAIIDVPVIDLRDVCAEYSADYEAHCKRYNSDTEALTRMEEILPHEVIDYLGLDMH